MTGFWGYGMGRRQDPPLPGLTWIPEYRLLGKRRNRSVVKFLFDDLAASKSAPGRRQVARDYWLPYVNNGLLPKLPTDLAAKYPGVVPIAAVQGAFLAVARRPNAYAPIDPLTDAVAGVAYGKICSGLDDPLSNVLCSWMFAVGYWAYHHPDPSAAANVALDILDELQPPLRSRLPVLTAEGRFTTAKA